MAKANDRAFPVVDTFSNQLGLTKREYFAGLAMQGLLGGSQAIKEDTPEVFADMAIVFADALIAALEGE